MSSIKGTNVLAPVVPFSTSDIHATHEAKWGKGGYRSVTDDAERDSIPALRREAGMLVAVVATGKVWKLGEDLATWTEWASVSAWSDITGKPSTFQPTIHSHSLLDITGLQDALAGKQPAGSYAAANHTHSVSDVTGLQTALNGKQPAGQYASETHTHAISDVSGLSSALASKATPSDVTSAVAAVVGAAPSSLDTLQELASALSNDSSFASTVTNAIAAKAPIASPTFTGTVSGVTKSMVGLGSVDNTADASKPVSTAQAAADAAVASAAASDATTKANAAQAYAVQRANHTGTQTASTISDFSAAVVAAAPPTTNASLLTSGTLADARLSGNVVLTTDSRLSDARTPASHTHPSNQITGLATIATSGSYADLANTPTIPSPSVAVYDGLAAFPATGAANVLYCDSSSSRLYRWESPIYVETGPVGGSYTLPNATNATLGGVIVGAGLSVNNGTVSANMTSVAGRTGAVTLSAGDVSGLAAVATSGSAADLSGTLADARLSGNVVLTGDSRLTNSRAPTSHASSHAAAGSDPLTLSAGQITGLASVATSGSAADLAGALADARLSANVVLASTLTTQLFGSSTVVDALPRIYAISNVQAASGQVLLVFFTPLQTVTISQISMATTAAGTVASGLTLCRMGLYTYTDAGTATLVARTASDTTLFAATNTVYTRSLDTTGGYPSTYTLTAGVRYGAGYIGVGTTQPQVTGRTVNSVTAGLSPRLSGGSGTVSDLPTSFTPSINSLAPFVRLS